MSKFVRAAAVMAIMAIGTSVGAGAQTAPPAPTPPHDTVPAPNDPGEKENPKQPPKKDGMVVKPPTGIDPEIVKPLPPVDSNMPVIKPEAPDGTSTAPPKKDDGTPPPKAK